MSEDFDINEETMSEDLNIKNKYDLIINENAPGYAELTPQETDEIYKQIEEEKQKKKENLAQKMKVNWTMCKKVAAILGQPQEAVFKNLELIKKYYKQIKPGVQSPHYINIVLREGKWPNPIVLHENTIGGIPASKVYEMGYSYKHDKVIEKPKEILDNKDKEPKKALDITFWYIKEMGSIEKAEKMLAAAKTVMEALK